MKLLDQAHQIIRINKEGFSSLSTTTRKLKINKIQSNNHILKSTQIIEIILKSEKEIDMNNTDNNAENNEFDFAEQFDSSTVIDDDQLLPVNTALTAINCGFVGIGGGGGKLAKAFLDLGFSKTLLLNTTVKDQPEGIDSKHFLLLPGADGVGKDVSLGRKVLEENSALVEDTLRTKLGKLDWLFVLAGSGGGTGSAAFVLDATFNRYLKSVHASGKVVYIITLPTTQELLNPTIKENSMLLMNDVSASPYIVLDNEKQLQLLRGKVGIAGIYPAANSSFAKLLAQILKLASENTSIQTFDSKDLERYLSTNGRMFLGTSITSDPQDPNLGATIWQSCMKGSPCKDLQSSSKTGVLLLVITPEMASDPKIANHIEAAFSYVGGRTDTLFSGVYTREKLPGLISIIAFGGLKD